MHNKIFLHVILSLLLMCLENVPKRIIPAWPCYFSYYKYIGNTEALKSNHESYLHSLILATSQILIFRKILAMNLKMTFTKTEDYGYTWILWLSSVKVEWIFLCRKYPSGFSSYFMVKRYNVKQIRFFNKEIETKFLLVKSTLYSIVSYGYYTSRHCSFLIDVIRTLALNYFCQKLHHRCPSDTRHRFNVYKTSYNVADVV